MYLTDEAGRRSFDLERLVLGEPGPATSCRLSAAPDGRFGVVNRRDAAGRRGLWLVRLGDPPSLERALGPSRSSPAWSPDGRTMAVCTEVRSSLVLDLVTGEERAVRGCHPVYLADGSLVTHGSDDGSLAVFRDGRVLLTAEDVAAAFPASRGEAGGPHVLGAAGMPDGSLLLAAVRVEESAGPTGVLARWKDGRLESAAEIPSSYGLPVAFHRMTIDVDARGTEAAFVYPERLTRPVAERVAAVVELRAGTLDRTLPASTHIGLAWSPDGAWLALTTGDDIEIYGLDRAAPTYVLPVRARTIAWSP